VGRKADLKAVDAVAREYGMTPNERDVFGEHIHQEKARGNYGSKANGDFTYAELREMAAELRRRWDMTNADYSEGD
jgi:hypothetical protein